MLYWRKNRSLNPFFFEQIEHTTQEKMTSLSERMVCLGINGCPIQDTPFKPPDTIVL